MNIEIQLLHFGSTGNKEPFLHMDREVTANAVGSCYRLSGQPKIPMSGSSGTFAKKSAGADSL